MVWGIRCASTRATALPLLSPTVRARLAAPPLHPGTAISQFFKQYSSTPARPCCCCPPLAQHAFRRRLVPPDAASTANLLHQAAQLGGWNPLLLALLAPGSGWARVARHVSKVPVPHNDSGGSFGRGQRADVCRQFLQWQPRWPAACQPPYSPSTAPAAKATVATAPPVAEEGKSGGPVEGL